MHLYCGLFAIPGGGGMGGEGKGEEILLMANVRVWNLAEPLSDKNFVSIRQSPVTWSPRPASSVRQEALNEVMLHTL